MYIVWREKDKNKKKLDPRAKPAPPLFNPRVKRDRLYELKFFVGWKYQLNRRKIVDYAGQPDLSDPF